MSEGGVRCSKALVDMYTALCSVAEENASVAAAHIAYAALLEKALSKVALQHVVSLEKLCQVGPPAACVKVSSTFAIVWLSHAMLWVVCAMLCCQELCLRGTIRALL